MTDNFATNDSFSTNDNIAHLVLNEEDVQVPLESTPSMEVRHEEHIEALEQAAAQEPLKSEPVSWVSREDIEELRSRWNAIQAKFVDEPRASVEQADALVADALARFEKVFAAQRLIGANHTELSTEDLRVGLKSYRTFFNRLLAL